MTKYLFYAAFLYFCYWAGNKAFPSAVPTVAAEVKKSMIADSTKAQPGNTAQVILPIQPGPQEQPVSFDIKKEINKAVAGSHILLIAMPAVATGNVNPVQDSIIRQVATRSVALLNDVNK